MQRTPVHLVAAESLARLRPPFDAGDWGDRRFVDAALEGVRRWKESQELFGAQWPLFEDAVAVLSPSFGLESRFSDPAIAIQPPREYGDVRQIALSFMKWARCPSTADYPNPYEPWIEIWEHGGSFRLDHSRFIDLYGPSGKVLGAVAVPRQA